MLLAMLYQRSVIIRYLQLLQISKKVFELLGLLAKLWAPHLRATKALTCLVRIHLC